MTPGFESDEWTLFVLKVTRASNALHVQNETAVPG
jgi:hypothetical protein